MKLIQIDEFTVQEVETVPEHEGIKSIISIITLDDLNNQRASLQKYIDDKKMQDAKEAETSAQQLADAQSKIDAIDAQIKDLSTQFPNLTVRPVEMSPIEDTPPQ